MDGDGFNDLGDGRQENREEIEMSNFDSVDNMSYDELLDERERQHEILNDKSSGEARRTAVYNSRRIERLLNERRLESDRETPFTDNDDGTVALGSGVTVPNIEFVTDDIPDVDSAGIPSVDDPSDYSENETTQAVEEFIGGVYKIEGFKLGKYGGEKALDFRKSLERTDKNNIKYRPKTMANRRGKGTFIVLKRDNNGKLQYNEAKTEEVGQAISELSRELSTNEIALFPIVYSARKGTRD